MDLYFVVENVRFQLIQCCSFTGESMILRKEMTCISGDLEVWRGNSSAKESVKILIAQRK